MKRSLGTGDLQAAQRRWQQANAEVDRTFAEAEKSRVNPSIAAYRAVQEWKQDRASRFLPEDEEDALDLHLTALLEKNNLSAHERAVAEALLNRAKDDAVSEDNPPLSILFDRYYSDRKLPAKSRLEWDGVLKRFTATVGDLPVRSLTAAHVRTYKSALMSTTSKRTGAPVSSATVQKNLNALKAVLSLAKREGYVTANPAEGATVGVKKDHNGLPYDTEDLTKLFSEDALQVRKPVPRQLLAPLARAVHGRTPGGAWAATGRRRTPGRRDGLPRHRAG